MVWNDDDVGTDVRRARQFCLGPPLDVAREQHRSICRVDPEHAGSLVAGRAKIVTRMQELEADEVPDPAIAGPAWQGCRVRNVGSGEQCGFGMPEKYGAEPARMRAAVGPCIAQASYEVGPEFPQPFLQQDPENRRFFVPSRRDGRFMFHLPGYVASRLERLGLAAVERAAHDTCAEADLFFSYRRATLAGEKDYGRGLSVIALTE